MTAGNVPSAKGSDDESHRGLKRGGPDEEEDKTVSGGDTTGVFVRRTEGGMTGVRTGERFRNERWSFSKRGG